MKDYILLSGKTVEHMTVDLYFENESGETIEFDFKEIATKIIENGLNRHKCPYNVELSLTVTTQEIIKELNNDMRGIDKVTDVLSFPNIEFSKEAFFEQCENREKYFDYFNPESGALILGDIVICLERAKNQAAEYGHGLLRELSFLTAHSLLHLLGYDHMEDSERIRMEELQSAILDELNIHR